MVVLITRDSHCAASSINPHVPTVPLQTLRYSPASDLHQNYDARDAPAVRPSFAFLCLINFTTFLATKHQWDVCTLSCRAKLEPLCSALHKTIRFFSPLIQRRVIGSLAGYLLHFWRLYDIAVFYINTFASDLGTNLYPEAAVSACYPR